MTYPKGYRLKNWAWNLGSFALVHKPRLRKMVAQTALGCNEILKKIENSADYLVIRPEITLPGGWLEKNPEIMSSNITLGRKAAETFLKSSHWNFENL